MEDKEKTFSFDAACEHNHHGKKGIDCCIDDYYCVVFLESLREGRISALFSFTFCFACLVIV